MANRQNKQRAKGRLRRLAQGMKSAAVVLTDASLPAPIQGSAELLNDVLDKDKSPEIVKALEDAKKRLRESVSPENLSKAFLPKPLQHLASRFSMGGKKPSKKSKKTKDVEVEDTPTTNENVNVEGSGELVTLIDESNQTNTELLEATGKEEKLLTELSEKQDKTIQILSSIDKNTKPDTLAEREAELEARKKQNSSTPQDSSGLGGVGAGAGILGSLSGIVGDLITGALGLKGMTSIKDILTAGKKGVDAGAAAKTGKASIAERAKNAFKSVGGLKGAAIAGAGVSAIASIGGLFSGKTDAIDAPEKVVPKESAKPNLSERISKAFDSTKSSIGNGLSSVKEYAKPLASKTAGVGSKLLGAPLMVASTAYDINEVSSNESLSDSQKNKEYTKIGTRLAGAWAGAKAGGALGAMGGGAVGAAFGGVGAAPGAAVGGIVGGIMGAIGGWEVGDSVGEGIGSAAFDDEPVKQTDSNVQVLPKHDPLSTTKIFEKLETSKDLPKNVESLVNGDSNVKYSDVIDDYQKWVESKGLTFDQKSASVALMEYRRERMKRRMIIESKDSMIKQQSDTLSRIEPISNLVSPSIQPNIVDEINVAESRSDALKHLSVEIERNGFKDSEPKIIQQQIAVPSSNQSQSQPTQEGNNSGGRLGVPNTRNSDNTIQRLLNNTYRPLLG